MRLIWKPLQWLYCVYVVAIFLVIMLIVFPLAVAASFLGRIRGGNLIFRFCTLWADTWFALAFIFTRRIFEAPHDKRRQYIFVVNHISYLDPAVLVKVVRQPVRPLAKTELSRIPVFGFIYRNAIVAVDRSSAGNRARSIRLMRSILSKGISVLVFPEGTFNLSHRPLKSFYDGAFRLAIETQIPVKPILFLDTYRRMHYGSLFSFTPGRNRVVYLDEIPVAGLTLSDIESLRERVYAIMEAKLIQYKAPWIGQTDREGTGSDLTSTR